MTICEWGKKVDGINKVKINIPQNFALFIGYFVYEADKAMNKLNPSRPSSVPKEDGK